MRRRPLLLFLASVALMPMGCHGQAASTQGAATANGAVPAGASSAVAPDLARRIEVLIRARGGVPPTYTIQMGPETHSDVPGYNQVTVAFAGPDGQGTRPVNFLVAYDGKTLAQFSKYDISADPKTAISDAGRPGRGGPEGAPVTIVGFDDLECPFCAKLHDSIFPALLQRYGNQVHFVYKDYPLPMHPWALRAAIDVNCLGDQSSAGYWNEVDHIHAHAAELGGAEKSVETANKTLDALTLEEGRKQHVDEAKLKSCVEKQDKSTVQASMQEGDRLQLNSTPVLFVNGEKFEGAYPPEVLFRVIDDALRAEGKTPPPPVAGESSQPAAGAAKTETIGAGKAAQ